MLSLFLYFIAKELYTKEYAINFKSFVIKKCVYEIKVSRGRERIK